MSTIFVVMLKRELNIMNVSGTIDLAGEIHSSYGSLWKWRRRKRGRRRKSSDASNMNGGTEAWHLYGNQ